MGGDDKSVHVDLNSKGRQVGRWARVLLTIGFSWGLLRCPGELTWGISTKLHHVFKISMDSILLLRVGLIFRR